MNMHVIHYIGDELRPDQLVVDWFLVQRVSGRVWKRMPCIRGTQQ